MPLHYLRWCGNCYHVWPKSGKCIRPNNSWQCLNTLQDVHSVGHNPSLLNIIVNTIDEQKRPKKCCRQNNYHLKGKNHSSANELKIVSMAVAGIMVNKVRELGKLRHFHFAQSCKKFCSLFQFLTELVK